MKKKISLVLALMSILGISQSATAEIWNVNFGSRVVYTNTGYYYGSNSPWTSVSGSLPSNKTINPISGTGTNTLTLSATGGTMSGVLEKMRGYITTGSPTTLTFNDNVSSSYILYVYSNTGSSYPFSVTGATGTTVTKDYETSIEPYSDTVDKYSVGRYYVSANIGTSVSVEIAQAGNINAIQVGTVPEPSSMLMLGVGGLVAATVIKRKTAQS